MSALLSFTGLLLIALLIEPVAARLRLPFGAALVAVGFAGSEALIGLGIDTGLRWYHFTNLILHVFLPVLVFESAFNLDIRHLFKNIVAVIYLAVPMYLLATCVTGTLIFLGIAHPLGFPWLVALLAGALVSATDPVAVVDICKKLGVPARLLVMLDGESLFNDSIAIVLVTLLLSLTTMPDQTLSVMSVIFEFLRIFFGGLVCGAGIGLAGALLMKLFNTGISRGILTLAAAIFSVSVAEHVFDVSGVMAVLTAGLIMGEANRRLGTIAFIGYLWNLNGYIATALIFLLVGATITVEMFSSQWLAMIIGIVAALLSRVLIVYVFLPPLQWVQLIEPISIAHRTVLFWGGLRGAVVLALALSLPLELEAWFTVQSIAYGVVLFTLLLQAPAMEPLLKRLKIPSLTSPPRTPNS